ncbi:TRAP transporter substrate-binding protein [Brevundimonas sp.]|jgi:tripartite ATP-independent transporter DctP family solute receptor|uniref:TRAP transporter substrate-binding protein n=1 Tax=Brevundimonas sp. TaxID=1871086 RepID=UPI00391B377F|nr:TRAP transporter substrate-binding protein [Brevundimonas sp.]
MRQTRRALIAAALAAPAAACVQEIGERPLRVSDTHPAGYPTVAAVAEMGRLLAEQTNGRLRFSMYPGGQLGEEIDTLEITIFGGLDLNRVNLAALNSIAAETIVPSLPFLFRSKAHMRAALDGVPGRAILDSLEPHGLIGLAFYDSGERSFYNTRGPIRTPSDLAGLKLRVQSSDLFVAMVQAMGGDPTPMSYGEVYQGLVTGVVDGAENNWPSYEDSRHFEVAGFYSLTRHVMTPEILVMSARTWRRLSNEERSLVRDCARQSVPFMRGLWDARETEARARVTAEGVQINEVDVAPFQALVAPVWDRFASSERARELVAQIQAIPG